MQDYIHMSVEIEVELFSSNGPQCTMLCTEIKGSARHTKGMLLKVISRHYPTQCSYYSCTYLVFQSIKAFKNKFKECLQVFRRWRSDINVGVPVHTCGGNRSKQALTCAFVSGHAIIGLASFLAI